MRALLFLFAALTLAAQPVDRSKPPVTPAVRAWKAPPVYETALPNGMTVVLVEDNRLPLVTMRLAFPCGNRRDPKNLPGVASAVADLLTHGTPERLYSQINETVERIGASVNATSGADQIVVAGSVIAENLPALLDVVSDVARNAEFPDLEVSLYRQNRGRSLARQRAQPANAANEAVRLALFGDHPYSHLGPTAASLGRIDRQALLAYRDTWIVPNNAFLILVGRLPARAPALKLIADRFGSWPRRPLPETADPAPPAPKRRLILIDRPGSMQAEIHTGRIAAMQRDADYFPMVVANEVVRAESAGFDEAGVVGLVSQARNDTAGDTLHAMTDRLGRIAKEPPAPQELADAKSRAIGSFLMQIEPQDGLADGLVMLRVLHLPADFIETYTARIEAVEPGQVQQAARKYLASGDDAIVVVGDAAKLQPQLRTIGDFEIVKAK